MGPHFRDDGSCRCDVRQDQDAADLELGCRPGDLRLSAADERLPWTRPHKALSTGWKGEARPGWGRASPLLRVTQGRDGSLIMVRLAPRVVAAGCGRTNRFSAERTRRSPSCPAKHS